MCRSYLPALIASVLIAAGKSAAEIKGLFMETQEFDHAVTATARQQAARLRELGFSAAAAEVDALLPVPLAGNGEDLILDPV